MRFRGLTMIETLLAIALLTLIVSAAASWTAMAGRLATISAAPARQETLLDAVCALIQRDLLTGDFEVEGRRGAPPPTPRVQVNDGVLEIRGRANAIHRYHLDRTTRVLQRTDSGTPRVLLHGVDEFIVTLDDDNRTLDVAIEMRDESIDAAQAKPATRTATRRFNLPW